MNTLEQDIQRIIDAAAYDMQVRAELEASGTLYDGYHPTMREIHEKNAQLLEAFLEHYGWPIPSKFGAKAHEAAWLITIHAISKPFLLRRTLQILEQALQTGEPVAQEYAKLFDRIALYEGRQQNYGTQFFPSPTGWYARDLVDPEHVDERRAALGLSTFLEGKKECGAEEGGFMEAEALEKYDTGFLKFLKEVGWR